MPRAGKPRGQPLCEVFGHPVNDLSKAASSRRLGRLCPHNNRVPECTKVSVDDPLGVCSIWDNDEPIIICPIRFREGQDNRWRVVRDAAKFLLPHSRQFTLLREISLEDRLGEPVGKFDAVLVDFEHPHVRDFGALEIQAVYITGNIRNPFNHYISEPGARHSEAWTGPKYPAPDWLSSIKRLVRQLTVKGAIFKAWKKRLAIAVQKQLFERLDLVDKVSPKSIDNGEMGWFIYDLVRDSQTRQFVLQLERTVYMSYDDAMKRFSSLEAGDVKEFEAKLQTKLWDMPDRRQLSIF